MDGVNVKVKLNQTEIERKICIIYLVNWKNSPRLSFESKKKKYFLSLPTSHGIFLRNSINYRKIYEKWFSHLIRFCRKLKIIRFRQIIFRAKLKQKIFWTKASNFKLFARDLQQKFIFIHFSFIHFSKFFISQIKNSWKLEKHFCRLITQKFPKIKAIDTNCD